MHVLHPSSRVTPARYEELRESSRDSQGTREGLGEVKHFDANSCPSADHYLDDDDDNKVRREKTHNTNVLMPRHGDTMKMDGLWVN